MRYKKRNFFQNAYLMNKILLKCSFITITAYYFLLILFYYLIKFNLIIDESINLNNIEIICSNKDIIKSNDNVNNNQTHLLIKTINKFLFESNLNLTVFICYRTLFEVMRLKNEFRNRYSLDLCIVNENNHEYFIFDVKLKEFFNSDYIKNKLYIDYQYNYFYGYYKLTLYNHKKDKNIIVVYLFMFNKITQNNHAYFINNGVYYWQFKHLAVWLNHYNLLSDSLIQNLNNYVIYLNKYKIFIPNDYLYWIMHYYPQDWWKTIDMCTL